MFFPLREGSANMLGGFTVDVKVCSVNFVIFSDSR